MIITKIKGGLGNQLFQYATGRAVASHHKLPLKLDLTWFETHKLHNGYRLDQLDIQADIATKNEIIKYSAGGLRDFTRIASSDPIMWRDIFIDNSDNILKVLDEFSKNIADFRKAITDKNGDTLLKIFSSTKNIRKEIIKAGQDVESPDFGRKKN